jgi:hypothetical protein
MRGKRIVRKHSLGSRADSLFAKKMMRQHACVRHWNANAGRFEGPTCNPV